MKWTLRRTLVISFCALVLMVGAVAGYLGAVIIGDRVYAEAQERVRSNLQVTRMVFDSRISQILTAVRICARRIVARAALEGGDAGRARDELARNRVDNGLDFLTLTDGRGKVIVRTAPPFQSGDSLGADELIMQVLDGKEKGGLCVFSRERLALENEKLPERAYTVIEETPHARPRRDTVETSGMVLIAAAPVRNDKGDLIGALYAGELVNRNDTFVDRIRDAAFGPEETYRGKPLGNVTIFLGDVRIATNVLDERGNRAIGSRVSKEVYDTVIENGRTWSHRAFVVNEWNLAAYAPLRHVVGSDVIGMIYMGIQARKYDDERNAVIGTYLLVIGLGVIASLAVGLFLAYRLSRPIDRLAAAAGEVSSGKLGRTVDEKAGFSEVVDLTDAFNRMSRGLKESTDELQGMNEALRIANRNYMETLGFVTHELKSPLASVSMNLEILRKNMVGEINEKQRSLVESMARNVRYFEEMIKNYLDLSRIEKGELEPRKTEIDLRADVVDPIYDTVREQFDAKHMTVSIEVPAGVKLQADPNLLKIVYDNLLSNAAKYGRDGSAVRLGFEEFFGRVRLNVRNEGKGIAPDQMDQLFQKFTRLPEEAQAKQKGTGLGLFICRQIVEKHGGKIWAESEPGQWADFLFEIPKGTS